MNLIDFYFQHIQKSEYHHRFYDVIENVKGIYNVSDGNTKEFDYSFVVFDAGEAIEKFKNLCEPNESFSGNENKCLFYLVTYFLYKIGYEIKEFPRLLSRPPIDPNEFTYRDIRNRIIEQGGDSNGIVQFATRRTFVTGLTFEHKSNHIDIDTSIEQKFIEISNRQASFNNMSIDEKLAEIANLIENMLKKNGNFITPDYSSICFDYITNEAVINYRKKLHLFRHATVEAISERNSFTDEQKEFLVDYGLTIVKAIHALTK